MDKSIGGQGEGGDTFGGTTFWNSQQPKTIYCLSNVLHSFKNNSSNSTLAPNFNFQIFILFRKWISIINQIQPKYPKHAQNHPLIGVTQFDGLLIRVKSPDHTNYPIHFQIKSESWMLIGTDPQIWNGSFNPFSHRSDHFFKDKGSELIRYLAI